MKRYNPTEIEPKWQKIWEDQSAFKAVDGDKNHPKLYVSPMFPYPSGVGMHCGHAFEHAIVDGLARFYRQNGYNVLNPMGWDAFGLPTENYAIKTGISPVEATNTFIENFKKQIKRLGSSIDWSREINTSDPEYYKWTQWIFNKLYERGLAYQKEALQWWCPVDKTVLANEQVEAGRCWRCGNLVEKKSMKQWFFRITEYADQLLDEIPGLDWPEKIKITQTNWIGKSVGAEVQFRVDDYGKTITVFSTRVDTIFGASFIVLAPEHPLAKELGKGDFKDLLNEYISASVKKSEIDRTNDTKEKTGVFTGSYAINPLNNQQLPIWVADYVLGGYGTGAVMGVPAHDERDYAFAEKFNLPIVDVIEKPQGFDEKIYTGEGVLINSGKYDGESTSAARDDIMRWLEKNNLGSAKTTYKMRDWLISRQRYWGAPIPIIHCSTHGAVAVPEDQLPVLLPEVKDFAPKGDGQSVLAGVKDWVETTCPKCGKPARRETDTMDGYACSSWYLLRYGDPHNQNKAWDPDKINYWNPLDFYVGGDHPVAHLLYVRFWTHVFKDMGLVDFNEPIKTLVYHGYINAEDGHKMSKSLGNVIDPLEIINQGYGADTLRTYLLFMGPIELDSSWDSRGIAGVYRFINRIWTLTQEYLEDKNRDQSTVNDEQAINKELSALMHKTIKKVTSDIYKLSFNTAIATLMEYVNGLYKLKNRATANEVWFDAISTLVQLVTPFAPHLAEELWNKLGNEKLIQYTDWPVWDESLVKSHEMTIAVQVNGKLRGEIIVETSLDPEQIKLEALNHENVKKFVTGEPKKVIYVAGRLVSIVV